MRLNKLIVISGLAALALVEGCASDSKKSGEGKEDTLEALEAETAEASDSWILLFEK